MTTNLLCPTILHGTTLKWEPRTLNWRWYPYSRKLRTHGHEMHWCQALRWAPKWNGVSGGDRPWYNPDQHAESGKVKMLVSTVQAVEWTAYAAWPSEPHPMQPLLLRQTPTQDLFWHPILVNLTDSQTWSGVPGNCLGLWPRCKHFGSLYLSLLSSLVEARFLGV